MADPQQLQRLQSSVDEWNQWRKQHPEIRPEFRGADLFFANLRGVNLSNANLSNARLSGADLKGANLSNARLNEADLSGATLSGATLSGATLHSTNLRGADFNSANLSTANLSSAHLSSAHLSNANLSNARLSGADLKGANLSGAIIGYTSFGDRDFRLINGLETTKHEGPSPLSINSIHLSQGNIPEQFVRGTGAPDTFIGYMRALFVHPIEYYTCFISYSSKDQDFAEHLYADLQHKGVRCWYAPEDLKIGDKFRTRIDESIRVHDKLLLVLSEHSVNSAWVEKEVETAFEKEHRSNKLVLFPIKLDETVMHTDQAWAADIRRMRHIGDLTRWKDHDAYQRGLQRLLRDLKQEKT